MHERHSRLNKESGSNQALKELLQKIFRNGLAKISWPLLQHFANIGLQEHSAEQLSEVAEYLEQGAVVIYVNHTNLGADDVMVGLNVILSKVGKNVDHIGGPVAAHHLDERYVIPGSEKSVALLKFLQNLGLTLWPVSTRKTRDIVPESEQRRMLKEYITGSNKFLGLQGALMGIAPEGERTDGTLQRAEKGVGIWVRKIVSGSLPAKLLPLGFAVDSPEAEGQKPKAEVVVGNLIDVKELFKDGLPNDPQVTADILMYILAELLPEEMRGVYSDVAGRGLLPPEYRGITSLSRLILVK